jgi:thiamine pyrophosphate-dependent acetolactate synthase large subunit-like protein
MSIKNHEELDSKLDQFLKQTGPVVLEVFSDPEEFHEPKVVAKLGPDGKFIPGSLENINWIES